MEDGVIQFMAIVLQLILLYVCPRNAVYTYQQLELNALSPCPREKPVPKSIQNINLIFQVGCTINLQCSYLKNYCDEKKSTNLTVIPPSDIVLSNMKVVNRSKCHVVVKIRNLVKGFSGRYICNDTLHGSERQRTMHIGYKPEKPTNLTLIYQPMQFIVLLFDLGKDGTELGDPKTTWEVTYSWRDENHTNCSKPKSGFPQYSLDHLYVACALDLRGQYSGGGAYRGNLGSVHNPITFNVIAINMFGNESVQEDFNVLEFIKPDVTKVAVEVVNRGTTWLQIKIPLPLGVTINVCRNHDLQIKYTVLSLPESEQSQKLEDNIDFHKKHGFWRNLASDEAVNVMSSNKSRVINWTDFGCNDTLLNVTGLLPNTYVNITLQAGSRYWGPVKMLNVDDTRTDEDVPLEGPKLDDKPYFCFWQDNGCVTCTIYFREIPRPLRGGRIMNYTSQGVLMSGPQSNDSSCHGREEFSISIGGQSNSFILPELKPSAIYNISLWAKTKKSSSPITVSTLHTNTSLGVPGAPTHVIVERTHTNTFKVMWRINNKPDSGASNNVTYFVHYCYALSFVNLSDTTNRLDCKTNLVTEKADNYSQTKTLTVPVYRGESIEQLTPTFFVSMVTSDGKRSGLSKSECFYSSEKAPDKVHSLKIQKSDKDPRHLVVDFKVPCGQTYDNGYPDNYKIEIKAADEITGKVLLLEAEKENWHIFRTFTDLRPYTQYCVTVWSMKKFMSLTPFEKDCQSTGDVRTGRDIELLYAWIFIGVLVLGVLLVIIVVKLKSKWTYAVQKFEQENNKFTLSPKPKVPNSKCGQDFQARNHLLPHPPRHPHHSLVQVSSSEDSGYNRSNVSFDDVRNGEKHDHYDSQKHCALTMRDEDKDSTHQNNLTPDKTRLSTSISNGSSSTDTSAKVTLLKSSKDETAPCLDKQEASKPYDSHLANLLAHSNLQPSEIQMLLSGNGCLATREGFPLLTPSRPLSLQASSAPSSVISSSLLFDPPLCASVNEFAVPEISESSVLQPEKSHALQALALPKTDCTAGLLISVVATCPPSQQFIADHCLNTLRDALFPLVMSDDSEEIPSRFSRKSDVSNLTPNPQFLISDIICQNTASLLTSTHSSSSDRSTPCEIPASLTSLSFGRDTHKDNISPSLTLHQDQRDIGHSPAPSVTDDSGIDSNPSNESCDFNAFSCHAQDESKPGNEQGTQLILEDFSESHLECTVPRYLLASLPSQLTDSRGPTIPGTDKLKTDSVQKYHEQETVVAIDLQSLDNSSIKITSGSSAIMQTSKQSHVPGRVPTMTRSSTKVDSAENSDILNVHVQDSGQSNFDLMVNTASNFNPVEYDRYLPLTLPIGKYTSELSQANHPRDVKSKPLLGCLVEESEEISETTPLVGDCDVENGQLTLSDKILSPLLTKSTLYCKVTSEMT